ncbi:MAG: DUF3488 domain-containing protein, partial [Candidatus Rokubacteria bacterium]|nr:DUF3488 domain-containing protein [Candidatus Rokubacteria bacterium]
MPTTFALRLATYLLVYDGLVALYLGGLIGPVGVGLVAVAVTASWWRDRLLAPLPRLREGSAGLIVVVAALSALDLLYFAGSTLIAMVRFLLFLVVYSLFMRRAVAHSRDVGLLAFVMLAAAAPATSSVGFLFAFLVFLVVGTWMLMLHHVVSESERSAGVVAGGAGRIGVSRDLLRLSVAGSVLTLAITAAFFFVIPRVGRTGLALGAQVGRMVSGFSERVELGAFGEIETDAAVVMRVQISEGPPELERLSGLRWRGLAFAHVVGRVWTVGPARRAAVKRSPSGQFEISSFRGAGALLVQDVSLEPIASEVIFGAARHLRVAVGADAHTVDDMRTVSVPPTARLHYDA